MIQNCRLKIKHCVTLEKNGNKEMHPQNMCILDSENLMFHTNYLSNCSIANIQREGGGILLTLLSLFQQNTNTYGGNTRNMIHVLTEIAVKSITSMQ